MKTISLPAEGEFAPYYGTYISKIDPALGPVASLEQHLPQIVGLLRSLSPEEARFAYAPGKWSLSEVIGHMIDAERIFAYRLLRIGRGDATPLPGFEENEYVPAGHFNDRSTTSLLAEYEAVRHATLTLIDSLQPEALSFMGTASEKPVSARALIWIMAGHEYHHWTVIRERYLGKG